MNFAKFVRIPFLKEHLRWLLLHSSNLVPNEIFKVKNEVSTELIEVIFQFVNAFVPNALFLYPLKERVHWERMG